MESVKMNRLKLLEIVKENKEKHIKEYADAVEEYKACVLELCKKNLNVAKKGDLAELSRLAPMPMKPTSYEHEYFKAIRMMELSVEDELVVQEEIFNQLVLDEWYWKSSFTATKMSYGNVSSAR